MFERAALPAPDRQINHGPAIAEIHDRLIACWYSGTSEGNPDARILCSRSSDEGDHWSAPQVAVAAHERARGARAPNKSVGNVTLFADARGRLWMIYAATRARRLPGLGNLCAGWRCGRVEGKVSDDDGATWSAGFAFDGEAGALARSKPIAAGPLALVPLYLEGARKSYLVAADLAHGEPGAVHLGHPAFLGTSSLIQPSLILWNGEIRAYLRDPAHQSVWTATFDAAANRWSAARPTNLPNPSAAIDAFTDDTGEIVLIYNPSRRDRHTLRLAVSRDGTAFRPGCDLAAKRSAGDVAYPYVIRARDGAWHVVYSSGGKRRIEHVRFDAAWLGACLAPRS